MTIHVGGLEQFMLKGRMDKEIARQKAQPPRWGRPMIFKTPRQALLFVERMQADAGHRGKESSHWSSLRAIMARTYDLYSWPSQADKVAEAIYRALSNGTGATINESGMTTTLDRNHDEIEISFTVGTETHRYRFQEYEGSCVPVPW